MVKPCATLLLAASMTWGCTQGTETPGSVGYVLLDRSAQNAWTLAQDDWKATPLLPLALDTTEPLVLTRLGGEKIVDLQADMLAHIQGSQAEITWYEVGVDIRDDRLLLHGTQSAAEQLAKWIGGEVASRGDGLWNLTASDIFHRASFLEPPEGILEALVDTQLDTGDFVSPSFGDVAMMAPKIVAEGSDEPLPGSVEAEVVGVYNAGTKALILDASGSFLFEDQCTGDMISSGKYYVIEDRVVLKSIDTAPMVLARNRDRLIHPGGAQFAPLLPVLPKRSPQNPTF